ncbi:hypothetical protein G9U51_07555 [Calidifontibacter sp. DB0510]|uniref:SAF domain-containing protein n=1 Tax=Metallococcus carri TaxID=1656884 RepID=A0A967E9W1_9MICO|nr:SAF domain-containing protein [Metallococcus carri]NHN55635.1 hypothetical protein [Metallococcus carri]NOP38181.1 hypothetical protein [Calidifontibacter sp. DB2511S]
MTGSAGTTAVRPQALLPAKLRGPGRQAAWRRARVRRRVSVVLFTLAALVGWQQFRPPPPPTVPVAVTRSALPAGHRITAADLRTVAWPATSGITSAATTAQVLGQVTTVDLPAGAPLTGGTASASNWSSVSTTEVAATVPLADPAMAALLRAGDRVDVYDAQGATLVLQGARLVTVTGIAPGQQDRSRTEAPVVVAALPRGAAGDFARAVAAASALGSGLVVVAHGSR